MGTKVEKSTKKNPETKISKIQEQKLKNLG
jgi:hypothetical protein